MVTKLQARVRELESELDNEQRRFKDAFAATKKYERMWKEMLSGCEEDKRMIAELQDLLEKTQLKMKQYKKQAEEAEEVATVTMNKYRKAQQNVEEAEQRADFAERSITLTGRSGKTGRSMSVTREVLITSSSSSARGAMRY